MLLAFDTATPFVTVALHDGSDVVVELFSEQKMKHGEQLAPLIEQAMGQAGVTRQDLTRIAVGVGPGPFTGLRVGLVTARTLGFVLEIPVHGVCSLDVLALEAVETGAVQQDFVVATDARRKEVYFASYDATAARLDGPLVDKPATLRTDLPVVGEGALPLPRGLPERHRPAAPRRRLAGARGGRGAGRAARPGAAVPAPPGRRRARAAEARLVTVRPATPDDVPAIAALEEANLGPDAWSFGLVEEGVKGALPTIRYLVAEVDGEVVGHAVASIVADIAELQRIAVDPAHRRHGLATALLDAVLVGGHGGRRRPSPARGPREQRGRHRLLRRPRLRRDRPPAPLLPRRRHRRGHAPRAQPLTGPDANVCAIEYPSPV